MSEIIEYFRQMSIAVFGSKDYTAGNKSEIIRRMRILLEADRPKRKRRKRSIA